MRDLLFAAIILFAGSTHWGNVHAESPQDKIRILWYNVENLFHPDNDPGEGDDEFTPEGSRHWSHYRYNHKLTGVAKVIIAAGGWEAPEMVGLCEVENAQVLDDLVKHPLLRRFNYKYVHQDSPDHRGLDVACLYRPDQVEVVSWRAIPSEPGFDDRPTRDMLHIHFSWGRGDSLDLILVHLLSKYTGTATTAEPRKAQIKKLLQVTDSLCFSRPGTLIVMAGDFNEEYSGYSMEPFRLRSDGKDPIYPSLTMGDQGSYKYRERWSWIDQLFWIGDTNNYTLNGSVLDLPVLMQRDELYGGVKPLRTYLGFTYSGGISDHLPILWEISRPTY